MKTISTARDRQACRRRDHRTPTTAGTPTSPAPLYVFALMSPLYANGGSDEVAMDG
jgi:hypothetical protein